MTNAEKKLRADIKAEQERMASLRANLVEVSGLPRAAARCRQYLDKHAHILKNLTHQLLSLIAEDYGTTVQGVRSVANISGINPLSDPDDFMVLMEDYTADLEEYLG